MAAFMSDCSRSFSSLTRSTLGLGATLPEILQSKALAGQFLEVALHGGSGLALAFLRRLFVKLTTTHFGDVPAFSQARLKRRIAISKGSFSLILIEGMQNSR
jgi:hypothetical protein